MQFSDLYGANGVGFYVGDTNSLSETDRKRATNDAYVELASLKGFWRLRTTDYTSSSSPALVSGTYQYNLPSDFSDVHRFYYRQSGRVVDVPVVSDAEWLERSDTATGNAGYPKYIRLTQTSATQNQFEVSPRISAGFISSVGTLTLSYYIEITRLVNDTDEPILPANLRWHIVPVAAHKYAIAQGDTALASALRLEAEKAKVAVLKHDLTRTGRPRQLRPGYSYVGGGARAGLYDYGRN